MAIVVRYQTSTKWATFFEIREFATKAAAQWFLTHHLPKNAAHIDIWTETDHGPRQQPTYYTEPKASTKWWDANKRPFSDGYEREELDSLTTVRRKQA